MKIFLKIIVPIIFLFFMLQNSFGQKKDIVITCNPFSFIEPFDAGFTPGIEFKIANKISLLSDAGFIFYGANNTSSGNTSVGYKLKPEFRYYFKQYTELRGFFISAEGLFKHVNYHQFDGVPIYDNMGNYIYTNNNGYRIIKNVYGLSAKIGYRLFFTKRKKLGLDIYAGLGARNKNFAAKDVPPGGSVDLTNTLSFSIWQSGSTISLPTGIKLIYKLK